MNNVQDCSTLYNNTVRPVIRVICGGWHFTHMLKALAWPHHFTNKGGLGHKKRSLPRTLFMQVPVPSQESEWSCFCVLGVTVLHLLWFWCLILELVR